MSDRKKNSLSPLSLHAQVRLCPKVKNCQCRNVISASFFSVNWFVSVFLQRDFFLFSWFSCSSVLYLIPQSLFQGFANMMLVRALQSRDRKFITVLTYCYLYLRVVGFYLNFRFFMHQNKQDKFFVCENLLGTFWSAVWCYFYCTTFQWGNTGLWQLQLQITFQIMSLKNFR